ncbi:Xaa-Pro peptidase family protein [Hoyosella sp. YIM 151337]|uniref:M24 family metallopeptidase n=1 Tax=Hoyosella sp. YIM 151337 TaxID=2992742 RepID=UPI002235B911|nr:Xaa-Pro peptidase family protein [Hoyosella sp. YIM 151337]MCW4353219.1 Xaa-Pro peptidase family protein [Hoyosella sp. YIM 151337]
MPEARGVTREQYGDRRQRLRSVMQEREVSALLVSGLTNVRYLTGFTGSNAALLMVCADNGGESATLICTDGRYTTQVAEQAPDVRALIARACVTALARHAVSALGSQKVGFESHVMTVDQHARLVDEAHEVKWQPTRGLVEQLRAVKDDAEISFLRRACAIGDVALGELISRNALRPGRSEMAVARELEAIMFDAGAERVAFETIVAAGANSAVPHHRPTHAELAAGDFVKIDFGAVAGGYHSDMTRTFVLGSEPQGWQRDVYELVREAQAAGCAALAPNAECVSVDSAARTVIAEAGYGDHFIHSLGHGVGLEIHEAPALAQTATGRLLSSTAVTVEPGVYLPGRGGVRIEDTLIVREGQPELLTHTSKDLMVV